MKEFKFDYEDCGYCRIYYTYNKQLFCIQDDTTFGRVRFELLTCTSEGEPCTPIKDMYNYAFDEFPKTELGNRAKAYYYGLRDGIGTNV